MFRSRRRRDATPACLLLLTMLFILSRLPAAAARPAPTTMTKPHGGGAVISRYSFFPDKPRWTRPPGQVDQPMVLTYALSKTDTVDYLPRDAVRAVLRSAFARWAEVIPVSFEEITDDDGYSGAEIKVGFYHGEHGDGAPFDGPRNVLAHASPPEDGGLHFDAAEHWSVDLSAEEDKSAVVYDLESVAVHEIGHILGLDHSTVRRSVMWPTAGPWEREVRLNVDDIEGVQKLYGANPNFSFVEYFKPAHETPASRFWQLGLAYILLVPF
uniref:Peptidase metallopeptidase domain-containing protein n=1 Tax=Leersia perrieri TaxID=77586 RepID=A0A0D9XMC7_9ORYZ